MSLSVERHDRFLSATCSGWVTMQDVRELLREVGSGEVTSVLVDCRLATRMPIYKELQMLTENPAPKKSVRAAFVCSSSAASGSARLLSSLGQLCGEVFGTAEEARAWLEPDH